MTTLSGGEVVLRCLAEEGVKRVIGITDEGYHTIQHHCREYGIRFLAPRHEAAGAHIAQGIYKSSGEVSAVLSGGGPTNWFRRSDEPAPTSARRWSA